MSRPSFLHRLRGAEAIEFALTVPLLLILLSGTMDFAWYFSQQRELIDAVREGARAGSVTPWTDGPADRATEKTFQLLAEVGVPFSATVESEILEDGLGDKVVRVHAHADYVGLWRIVMAPYRLDASATMRIDDQPAP
ncbi:MAG: pilus assembly protein [Alphaproteobacteria bacterium]|nr:pilus assembly protein [Alphaproteobacteria bacterium]MCB9695199.1 pilus assembly protein [Alphaproteobacteria bacterium]